MKLDIRERILALNALPQQGNMLDLIIVENTRKSLTLTETEISDWGVASDDGGMVTWSPDADTEKDFELSIKQSALLVKQLEKLDKAEELTPDHISLCQKLGVGKDE
jgi:hypothetical protein